jgi:peptide/nickel transport system permease protein
VALSDGLQLPGVGVDVGDPVRDSPQSDEPRTGHGDFLRYLAGKLTAALVSFGMLLVIGFVIFSLMPSNPVAAITRGHRTSTKQQQFLIKSFGLDQPWWERFFTFVWHTVQGQLGYSWGYQASVSSLIWSRLGPTLLLMGTSTVISVVLGMWLGIRSGWRHGSLLDRLASGISLTLWSVPTFWLGLILLVLLASGGVGPIPALFPAGGMSTPGSGGGLTLDHISDVAWHLALPCLTLVAVIFAQYVTIMRSSMIDELGSQYLLTARAKGLRYDDVRR